MKAERKAWVQRSHRQQLMLVLPVGSETEQEYGMNVRRHGYGRVLGNIAWTVGEEQP